MITYCRSGEHVHSKRDILREISEKHNNPYMDESIRADGYTDCLKVGNPEVAEIEVYFSTKSNTEFAAISMLSFGDNIEGYVFREHYDAMMFLKEFTPVVESVLKIHELSNRGV